MTLAMMSGYDGRVVDVNGAFLLGELDPKDEIMYLKIPEGLQSYYKSSQVLKLKKHYMEPDKRPWHSGGS